MLELLEAGPAEEPGNGLLSVHSAYEQHTAAVAKLDQPVQGLSG
jgi:hypothetical protein